jgi:hypothetical protein
MGRPGKNHRLALKATSAQKVASSESRPGALTVKVDDGTYVRLCTLKATQRRTSQEILHDALHEYLRRAETERRPIT